MDYSRFSNLGFSSNRALNALEILGSSMQVQGTDTVLSLDSPGSSNPYMSTSKGIKRKWSLMDGSISEQVGSSLALRLGQSSSSSDSKGSSTTACTATSSAKETDEESSMDIELDFTLHLGNEKVFNPKISELIVDLELSLCTGISESDITSALNADERSTSCHWKPGIGFPQSQPAKKASGFFKEVPRSIDLSPSSVITAPKSSVTCTSGITWQQQPQQHSSSSKICQVEGCGKGARGASGRCISHGGGRRCQKPGCHKGAEGRTVYCKSHGGGRRCEFLGCTKSAEGRTDFCIAHGGGRRCSHDGCTRAARGKSGLCIRHGGGKRCQMENCTRSAEGLSGLCISHGGGRRCQFIGCTKGAQGSTVFCKAHGGGRRCTYLGCTKGAEGSTPFCKGHGGGKRCAFQGDGPDGICTKSVHGGTNFCVAHGGGKRCAVLECTKSARGRTDYCVRHGGGKRCKFEACDKSAQGSTDFCKAHGGGKRCSWGHPGSEYGNQPSDPCNSFARGKTGLCALHSSLVQDNRVHGGETLGPIVVDPKLIKSGKMKEISTTEDLNTHHIKMWSGIESGYGVPNACNSVAPEGRVHGGSLMAMLAGGSGLASATTAGFAGGPSEPNKYFKPLRNWIIAAVKKPSPSRLQFHNRAVKEFLKPFPSRLQFSNIAVISYEEVLSINVAK